MARTKQKLTGAARGDIEARHAAKLARKERARALAAGLVAAAAPSSSGAELLAPADAGAALKKKRRFRPGTVALREIRKLQKDPDAKMLLRAPFTRLVREVADAVSTSGQALRFTRKALDALQEYAEDKMHELFSAAIDNTVLRGGAMTTLVDVWPAFKIVATPTMRESIPVVPKTLAEFRAHAAAAKKAKKAAAKARRAAARRDKERARLERAAAAAASSGVADDDDE